MYNIILDTDSYKISHWPVYPEGTEYVYSYLESRGGDFPETVFFGFSYLLRRYLSAQVTQEMIDYAAIRFKAHFGTDTIFNRAGWQYIVDNHNGYLPLRIKAPVEGSVIPTRNVLLTIENTDPKCFWLTNYVETAILRVWYPITVATLSREIKKVILKALIDTGTPALIPFKLHDFGSRGVSSQESAAIGGAAHLVNFMGSDTFVANEFLNDYYSEPMAGFSIPATEHSIMCAKGEEGEVEMMKRFLETFADAPVPAIACVSDTYNLWRACSEYWGGELKGQVEALNDKVLVVRPDSGDPVTIVVQTAETLEKAFGSVTNDKGYRVLNHVRIIQGDGVNLASITAILAALKIRGFSADNIAFGMGGALLQQLNRDTQKFAIKASSYVVNNVRKDYQKNPITDMGKRSKAGRLKLIHVNGVYSTVASDEPGYPDALVTVFENGGIFWIPTLSAIRNRAKITIDGVTA